MFTDLAIIIVNWNLKLDTLECIASLVEAGASLEQIIVVDNGSTDSSIQALRDIYPERLQIIALDANCGYATGVNRGLDYALINKSQWILLLNNDTIVTPTFIEAMQAAIQTNPSFSIFAPMILYYSQPSLIWSMGDRRVDRTLLTINPYRGKNIDRTFPKVIPIDFTTGCAMLVNRNVFEKIGLLDESFFMYGEEVDFCWRARQAGFTFACIPAARLWHKISKSSSKDKPGTRYLRIRNQIRFYRRYSSPAGKWFYFIYTLVRSLILCAIGLVTKESGLIGPTLRGWWAGWNFRCEQIGA
jgi:GT2 family glycosyltransferase